ncbi:hypothetical protein BBJ29_001458 [Phytophthora kernoviae]|uniref:PH domain-containing protein n=1 Tax=Phytophthora kernoviae TaxID=325452 RepID=A0A3F2S0P2_9STRA|nr:hypothetical protein BBP00_00001277 [Phytophthora kernoviae]RLN69822.1 hypothetical protein BBJ29_001458 [Phytophthora kernoviae]
MDGPPSKYSLQQFFVSGSRESLGLRQLSAVGHAPNSPRALREVHQSRDSFLSLCSTMSSVSSFHTTTPLPQGIHIQGWMYWARHEDSDATRSSERYTKVYAVLRNEFLLLYRNNQRQSKKVRPTPLVQIAVAHAYRSVDSVLHVEDPFGEEMELHLYNREDHNISHEWSEALEQAAELTHAHFSNFDVKVEDLSRGSVYRGTLHDFRVGQESSIRKSVMHIKKFNRWQSLRKFIPSRVSSRLKYSRSSS